MEYDKNKVKIFDVFCWAKSMRYFQGVVSVEKSGSIKKKILNHLLRR